MDPLTISKIISEDLNEDIDRRAIPTRPLGRTGFKTTIIGLGGQGSLEHQGNKKNNVRIITRAYELGIKYFDSSPVYGPSQDYYAAAFKEMPRKKIFFASKTDDRTRDGSLRIIEKSLKQLGTDYLDLWQIHHLDKIAEVDEVCKDDGALQALIEMKEQKVVRNIGFTGHENPDILIEMSKRYDFDTVLCPVNAAEVHVQPSFVKKLLPIANKQRLGIIGMKIFAQGFIFNNRGIKSAWEALTYALSQPIDVVIIGCDDVGQLEENVAIAKAFKQLSAQELKEIEDKTITYPKRGAFFRSKYGGYGSKYKLKKIELPVH